jgi:serine/threonine protein kinase
MHKFGKYEVLEQVGVGGFGVVWKAFDPLIKRTVAVKTCTSDETEIRDRFFQEAEIAGNLQHRNIVTVYDFGVQEGVPYLVQEFLDGEDLDKKIQRNPDMEAFERVSYLLQIARGLEFAHSKGVVHRDIKPANIRILEDGTAKILDFGIAKLSQRRSGLTQTGMTLGTAQYLAPEQIRGEDIDGRTDIFSFGLLAYELLTYQKAFDGESLSNVIYQILHKEPAEVTRYWPDAPIEAQRLVTRCMAKDPSGRYPTTSTLVGELEQLARTLRSAALGQRSWHPADEAPTRAMPARHIADALESHPNWGRAPHIDLPSKEGPRTAVTKISALPPPESSRGSRLLWATLGALGLAVLVTGALFYLRSTESTASGRSVANATSAAARPATPAPAPATPPAATTPAPAPAAPTVPTATTGAASANSSPGSTTPTGAIVPPAVVEPPKPQPPKNGTLAFATGWDPRVTVSVAGGPPVRLERALRRELPPGDYDLVWSVDLGDYRDSAKSRASVVSGATVNLAVPLPAPGRLTVQAALGSPRGVVRVDGAELGPTPLRNRALKAGDHRLEILPAGGATNAPVAESLTIRPGTQTLVTIDLARGVVTSLHEKPLDPTDASQR